MTKKRVSPHLFSAHGTTFDFRATMAQFKCDLVTSMKQVILRLIEEGCALNCENFVMIATQIMHSLFYCSVSISCGPSSVPVLTAAVTGRQP